MEKWFSALPCCKRLNGKHNNRYKYTDGMHNHLLPGTWYVRGWYRTAYRWSSNAFSGRFEGCTDYPYVTLTVTLTPSAWDFSRNFSRNACNGELVVAGSLPLIREKGYHSLCRRRKELTQALRLTLTISQSDPTNQWLALFSLSRTQCVSTILSNTW